jgi:hypothetical protein
LASRNCKADGLWQEEEKEPAAALQLDDSSDQSIQNVGYTDYSQCYLPEMRDLLNKLKGHDGKVKLRLHFLNCFKF